jgi:two-component system NtrC family sensor kinase
MIAAGVEPERTSMAEHSAVATAGETGCVDAILEAGRLAALGELTAGAAHEINNPLFAILTLVDFLLREAEPGTKAYDRLRLVEGSARDIEAVVGRVHRFARGRAGDGSPFPLEEVAAGAVDLVRHASAARDVELVESYPAVPALVAGDPRRLAQVFVNLLLNALQARPEGGTVTTSVEREGTEIVAIVADDGPGIPPRDAERLFELWTTTRPGSGSGLGLAVSRTVAELHGGALAVDPAAARGARLVLRLPAAEADA